MTGPRRIQNRRDFVWSAMTMLATVAALVSFMLLYVNHEMRAADERWCDLFVGLDDNYRSAPPASLPDRSKKFARQIHQLRRDLHCQDTPVPSVQPTASPSR